MKHARKQTDIRIVVRESLWGKKGDALASALSVAMSVQAAALALPTAAGAAPPVSVIDEPSSQVYLKGSK